MREILFRAKTEPNCKHVITGKIIKKPKWVYGYIDLGYMHDNQTAIISDTKGNASYRCQYETIGQYTGLTDKNGTKIFEGDVVDIGEHDLMVNGLYCVIFCMANHCWALQRGCEHRESYFSFSDLNGFAESSVVVGNIHDNPELV